MERGTIISIMIGATSDLSNAVAICKSAIERWNSLNAIVQHIVLVPLHWETSVCPQIGLYPQDVINKQIVSRSDALICLFHKRLGSPTPIYKSGCIEEIEQHRKADKPVMVFFIKSGTSRQNEDDTELSLSEYKKEYGRHCLYSETTTDELEMKVFNSISLLINQIKETRQYLEIIMTDKATPKDIAKWIRSYVDQKWPHELSIKPMLCPPLSITDNRRNDTSTLYGKGLADSQFQAILELAAELGFATTAFNLSRYDSEDDISYASEMSYCFRVMRYSIGEYPNIRTDYHDVFCQYYKRDASNDDTHFYMECENFADILMYAKFWLLTLKEYDKNFKTLP